MNTPKTPALWLSEHDVRTLVVSARKAKASLIAIITGIEERVAARRDVLNKSLSDLDTKSRLAAIDSAASKIKADEKIATNAKRTEILRSLARMNEQAKGAIPFYESSVQMLLRDTIASFKRATIYDNLASAGPVELKAFASLAIATADKDMGSAVVSRLHALSPASARPVSPRAVSDALVGELQREMHLGLLEVDGLLQAAVVSDRLFEQGRAGDSGIASVELALKRRREAEVGGKRVDDSDEG